MLNEIVTELQKLYAFNIRAVDGNIVVFHPELCESQEERYYQLGQLRIIVDSIISVLNGAYGFNLNDVDDCEINEYSSTNVVIKLR